MNKNWEAATGKNTVPLRVMDRPSVSGVLMLEVYGQDEFAEPKRVVRRAVSSARPTLGVAHSEAEMDELFDMLKDKVLHDLMQDERGIDSAQCTDWLMTALEGLRDTLSEMTDALFPDDKEQRDYWRNVVYGRCDKIATMVRALRGIIVEASLASRHASPMLLESAKNIWGQE